MTEMPMWAAQELAARRVAEERDFYRAELKEAHSWMLAQGWCDCEYFEGAGTKPCRFAEALARKVPA